MGRVEGKVAIVTGAAKGLGEADARLFAAEGATVILTDVDVEAGERVAAEIAKETGSAARFVRQDVADEQGWIDLIDAVVAEHGGLDILVNNAGVVVPGTPETQTKADYDFIMQVSADGSFFGCKYAIPAMAASGGGSIVNMCSLASIQGEHIFTAYCMAKGAVESLTRAVAVHCGLAKNGIRCNSVHPSGIMTPMVAAVGEQIAAAGLAGTPDDDARASGQSKIGEPIDIANTVLFLASDESKFINGAAIRVDNAMSVVSGVVPE